MSESKVVLVGQVVAALLAGCACASNSSEEGGVSTHAAVAGQPDAAVAEQPECGADSDCDTGFCDLGHCAAVDGPYGRTPCISDPGPKEDVCGAYLCVDGRCRSCSSDSDCGSGSKCYIHPDRPGQRCGSASNPGDDWIPVDG